MATLKELIERRVERLDSVPATLISAIDKQNELLFKETLKLLDELDIQNGRIVASTDNLAKVNQISERLKQTLFGGEYVEAIRSFASEISAQASINNEILAKTLESVSDTALNDAAVKAAQVNTLRLLDESAIDNNLIQPIQEILSNAIITNTSISDAADVLRKSMTGESALLTKYAQTYAKDAFATSDRQYAQLIARDNGIEFYRWSGGTVSDTREFCEERNGKIFHEKEIQAWGNHIKTRPQFVRPTQSPIYETKGGIKIYWEGMNYDTNSSTIMSFCGGYNCNHVLVPVATEYVPKADKLMAKNLGYYEGEL